MRYVKVEWSHNLANERIVIYSEVSDQGWEIRKIERFADRTMASADKHHGLLAEVHFPGELSEIARAGSVGEFFPRRSAVASSMQSGKPV